MSQQALNIGTRVPPESLVVYAETVVLIECRRGGTADEKVGTRLPQK